MSDTALGIDFYSDNSAVWEGATLHPPAFAIIGATTGLQAYYDKYGGRPFADDWAEAARRGIARSAYHFYIQGLSPAEQALKFLSVVNGAGGVEDIPLALDVEIDDAFPYPRADGLRAWLEGVKQRTGKRPMIYTSAEMWGQVLGDVSWAVDYEIWLAGYPDHPPGWHPPDFSYHVAIPEPWKSAGKSWTFWQYAGGGVDQDTFKGSPVEFELYSAYYKSGGTPLPPDGGHLAEKIMVTTDRVNVRSAPTTSATKLFTLETNTKIVVDPGSVVVANGYHWFKWLIGQGYVAGEFLKDNPLA